MTDPLCKHLCPACREHLARAEEKAIEDQESAKQRFRDWVKTKVPDAEYMNICSGAQVTRQPPNGPSYYISLSFRLAVICTYSDGVALEGSASGFCRVYWKIHCVIHLCKGVCWPTLWVVVVCGVFHPRVRKRVGRLGSFKGIHPTMHGQLPSAVRGPCMHIDAWLTLSSCPERDVMAPAGAAAAVPWDS